MVMECTFDSGLLTDIPCMEFIMLSFEKLDYILHEILDPRLKKFEATLSKDLLGLTRIEDFF